MYDKTGNLLMFLFDYDVTPMMYWTYPNIVSLFSRCALIYVESHSSSFNSSSAIKSFNIYLLLDSWALYFSSFEIGSL